MYRRFKLELTYKILVLVQLSFVYSFRVPLLSEELGCSPTLSLLLSNNQKTSTVTKTSNALYYFDPFQLGTDTNFSRYREAEHKHGRIAMLAMTEIILIPIVKRFLHLPTFWGSNGEAIKSTILLPPPDHAIVANLLNLKFYDVFPVLITCGFLEIFIFVQQDVKDMPGDYGIGYFGLRNKGLHEQQLLMELEHGRLAMVSFVVYVLLDATIYQETSWLDQWIRFFEGISLQG